MFDKIQHELVYCNGLDSLARVQSMHGAHRASRTDMQDSPLVQYVAYQYYIKMHLIIYSLLHETEL